MNEIVVSEIQIIPVKPKDGLVAFASCVINSQFFLGNIAIYSSLSSPDGFRLVYPTKILNNGRNMPIAFPVNQATGFAIQKIIVEKYLKLVEKLTKGVCANERSSAAA